jgi:serine/threonine protein kinase
MGEVWAATHAITRRRVAMKFLKGSAAKRSEMHQRFLREARALSLVRHPSVVEVLDVFELNGGGPVMVMDLLIGETLGAKLARDGPLPVGRALALTLPVVEALEAAHARGIVHRDLKPDNIFLEAGDDGHVIVKVLDFGIAKLTAKDGDEAETGPLTGTGSVLGTPWYMAPEQLSGEKDIDPRADVWALGVILYECLSGRRPVDGSNVAQLVMRMVRDGIVPIEERLPGIAPEVARLIGRMLARERDERPRDLAEVRRVLAKHTERVAPEPQARWDTGVPLAVPSRQHTTRAFAVFRISAAIVAVAGAVVVAWGVAHSTSQGANQMTADAPAQPATSVATAAFEGTAAASVIDVPSATSAPDTSRNDVAAPTSEYRPRPSAPLPPSGFATPRRMHVIAEAGMAPGKTPAAIAPEDVKPVGSAQPRPERGGLFEAVPF